MEPAYESGYAVLSPHPQTEAEGRKFSEEYHKVCTTDNVEQYRDVFMEAEVANYIPDEETKSEEVTSEEIHGEFNEFTVKELEEKELKEKFMKAKVASYPVKSEETISEEFRRKFHEALDENFESCKKAEAPLQTVEVEGASDDPATITAEDEENRDVVSQEDEGLESQEDQTRFVMAKLLWIKQTTPAPKIAEAIVHLLRDLKDGVTNNCTQEDGEPPRRCSDC